MAAHNIIDRSTVFKDENFPVVVMNAEHQGKVSLHSHSFFELVYIDSGFSLHSCNGAITILTSGDLFVMRPGDIHSYNSAHNTRLYNCLFCSQALEWIEDELKNLPGIDRLYSDSNLPWKKINLGLAERREAVLFLEKMKWESLTRGAGWQINIKSLLAGFLVFYSRLYMQQYDDVSGTDKVYTKYIYRLLEYIEKNLTNDITTRDIADAVGLSPDYLTKQFKNALGLTPAEYIRYFRVAKAMEMLKNTDISVAEIALKLGFSGVSQFSRQFKTIFGMAPSEFRKKQD